MLYDPTANKWHFLQRSSSDPYIPSLGNSHPVIHDSNRDLLWTWANSGGWAYDAWLNRWTKRGDDWTNPPWGTSDQAGQGCAYDSKQDLILCMGGQAMFRIS